MPSGNENPSHIRCDGYKFCCWKTRDRIYCEWRARPNWEEVEDSAQSRWLFAPLKYPHFDDRSYLGADELLYFSVNAA